VKAAGQKGQLTRVFYVKGSLAGTTGAEAWICQDSDGTLYYQGHAFDGDLSQAKSANTIILGKPIAGEVTKSGSTWTASNPTSNGLTQYIVGRDIFRIVQPSGDKLDYTVTKYAPN
jgi:hypothetical protein